MKLHSASDLAWEKKGSLKRLRNDDKKSNEMLLYRTKLLKPSRLDGCSFCRQEEQTMSMMSFLLFLEDWCVAFLRTRPLIGIFSLAVQT